MAGAIVEWRGSEDPRGAISVDHLLRMTSGLAIREDQTGVDPNSRMLFLEPDPSGTPVGSSFMLASARDWARLGQLYLDGGRWKGRRILPEGWVDYVTRHTPASGEENYGAGFWINDAPEGPRWPLLPRDTYAASGFQHQRIFIVPSAQLVVVRLGATRGDRSHLEQLAAGVIAARR